MKTLVLQPTQWWTISFDYDARNDKGKTFRARSCIQVEAKDIPSAYNQVDRMDWGGINPKFGVILPGRHDVLKI